MATEQARLRLFVALELPSAVRAALGHWGAAVAAAVPGLRGLGEEGLHVTLCFLGGQPPGAVEPILAACRAALAGHAPAQLAGGAPAWLPIRAPRVLAAGLSDATGALGEIQTALSDGLTAGGWYRPERRPFLPHVTVARVRRGERVRPVTLQPLPPLAFAGSRVTLFRSALGGAGARYEALGGVGLGPPVI